MNPNPTVIAERNMTKAPAAAERSAYFVLGHIFGAHAERIGLFRTVMGVVPLVFLIPGLVVMHALGALLLYQGLIRRVLGTPALQPADHIVWKRDGLNELNLIDQFACAFCSYANGLGTMIHRAADHVANMTTPVPAWQRSGLFVLALATVPVHLFWELCFVIGYDGLAAIFLGVHRIAPRAAWRTVRAGHYGAVHGALFRAWLCAVKASLLRLSGCLEQIETSWCPLRHIGGAETAVYPEHQRHFFGRDQLEEMRGLLRSKGSLSDRQPRF